MKTLLVFIFLLFSLQENKPVNVVHHGFLADGKGQFIVLKPDGIDLVDKDANVIRHHSEKLLGHIGSVDRTSFMRLMVFYDEVPGYQLLDNTLSPHSDLVDLNVLERPYISMMCPSSNNSYWMYDKVNFELIRLSDKNREISNSGNLMNVIGITIDPFKISEAGNRLYMADKEHGLLVFDQFGVFLRKEEIQGILDFSVEVDERIFVLLEDKVLLLTNRPWSIAETSIPVTNDARYIDVDEGNIYVGTGKDIWKYER